MSEQLLNRLPKNLARTGAFTTLTALVGSAAGRSPEKTSWFRNLASRHFNRRPLFFRSYGPPCMPILLSVPPLHLIDSKRRETVPMNEGWHWHYWLTSPSMQAGVWVFFRSHRLAAAPVIAAALAVE